MFQGPDGALTRWSKGNPHECQQNKKERHEELGADAVHAKSVHSFRGQHKDEHKAHRIAVMLVTNDVCEYNDRRTDPNETPTKCA